MKKISLLIALGLSLVASVAAKETPESQTPEVTFLPEGKPLNVQLIPSYRPLLLPLGTRPAIGRDFIKQDFERASPPVAIISSTVWGAAGSRPDVIGRKIKANGQEYVVVAVAPKSPAILEGMKVWLAVAQ